MLDLTTETLPAFKNRFNALRADTPRKWGKLSPQDMILHLCGVAELSLGDRSAKKIGNIFTYTIGKYLIFYVLPWPKGKIKVPEEWTPASQSTLEAERAKLFALMERFVDRAAKEPNTTMSHPMFGDCKFKLWQRIHGKHFNHHLTQFGV